MGKEITKLNHGQGFTANIVTGAVVAGASFFGMTVSTTHVSVGALFGIGAVNGEAKISTIKKILWSWVATLPLAAGVAALTYFLIV